MERSLKRGEVWTASGGPDYFGKPRPVVVVQNTQFGGTNSITVCGITTDVTEAPAFRPEIDPTPNNGLLKQSRVMADKVTTMPKTKLRKFIGLLNDSDIIRVNRALAVFLGLANSPSEMSDQI